MYTGSVQEIGGNGEVFENLVLSIGNGSDCVGGREGAQCFPATTVEWANGNFTLKSVAPYWLDVPREAQYFSVDVARNDTLYLNAATVNRSVFVQVDADITVDLLKVVEGKQEEVGGSLEIIAQDTNSGLPDIEVIVYLYDANQTQLATRTVKTNEDGTAVFVFEADSAIR